MLLFNLCIHPRNVTFSIPLIQHAKYSQTFCQWLSRQLNLNYYKESCDILHCCDVFCM